MQAVLIAVLLWLLRQAGALAGDRLRARLAADLDRLAARWRRAQPTGTECAPADPLPSERAMPTKTDANVLLKVLETLFADAQPTLRAWLAASLRDLADRLAPPAPPAPPKPGAADAGA